MNRRGNDPSLNLLSLLMKTFFQLGLVLTIGSFIGLSYTGNLPTTDWDNVVENTIDDTLSFGTLGVTDTLVWMDLAVELNEELF
jgi:hypothetical protein